MRFQIIYQTWDGTGPVCVCLTPEQYFDPLGPGETYAQNAVPRYNHTWQYLDVPPGQLKWSIEGRSGTGDDTTIRTQYLDGGRSWMTHRQDPDGFEEIIHATQVGDDIRHTLRTFRYPGGAWAVHLASVIERRADGPEKVTWLDQSWSFEEARAYSETNCRRNLR